LFFCARQQPPAAAASIGYVYTKFTRACEIGIEADEASYGRIVKAGPDIRRVQPGQSAPGVAPAGIGGIAVGLNAIGLLCIGARNDYVCRAAMSLLT
jgi:hypothetical protein